MKPLFLTIFASANLLVQTARAETTLSNEFLELKLQGAAITSLRAGSKQIDFIKNLKPGFWRETSETQIKVDGTTTVKIDGTALSRHFQLKAGETAVITASALLNSNKPTE